MNIHSMQKQILAIIQAASAPRLSLLQAICYLSIATAKNLVAPCTAHFTALEVGCCTTRKGIKRSAAHCPGFLFCEVPVGGRREAQ